MTRTVLRITGTAFGFAVLIYLILWAMFGAHWGRDGGVTPSMYWTFVAGCVIGNEFRCLWKRVRELETRVR